MVYRATTIGADDRQLWIDAVIDDQIGSHLSPEVHYCASRKAPANVGHGIGSASTHFAKHNQGIVAGGIPGNGPASDRTSDRRACIARVGNLVIGE